MYNVCAHKNLPTSAILTLGLLIKKEMNNFAWAVMYFRFSGASQAHFNSFEGNADTTLENSCTVKLA